METVFVSLISLALIIISTVTMAFNTLKSSNDLAESWKTMQAQASSITRTDIDAVPPAQYLGGVIDITVENEGQTNLGNFPSWDAIVQYDDGSFNYLTYTESNPPGDNQWTVSSINLSNGNPEVFDPNILDPGENMTVSIDLNPDLAEGQTGIITISTPNGVKALTYVTRV